jgi:demethoxyubiquinone hydroxylase (CLK1/Coq7/Cat5 family)
MPGEATEPQPPTDLPRGGDHRGNATAENRETATSDLAATSRPATEPPKLSRAELLAAQQQTLARLLFTTMDLLYGRQRTLSKFKMLELIARVPYQSWEQVAYIAVTHVYRDPGFARRVHDRIAESRVQQDNEQWHLLILEELVARSGKRESQLRYFWVPQAIAFGYYQLSWLLYVIRPAWSYRLNADFEDHAEHEYMEFVAEHPGWETEPFESAFSGDYGRFDSLADLFRQIGHDERVHKQESLAQAAASRFR